MPEIIDDKSEHCVPFILDRITKHRESYASKGEEPTPFFVGLNGVQGAGKTTLVCTARWNRSCYMINMLNSVHCCISIEKERMLVQFKLRC
jgi:pantothenate kinase-related protein Tda10